MYNPKITIKGEEFNSRNTLVIAEMANAHDGNVEIAKKIIKASADGGANAVKVQRILADEISVPGYSYYEILKKCEMPIDEWKGLVEYAKDLGLMVFADVFGETSLADMEQFNLDAYEIHSSDITNSILIKKVAETGKPVFLYVGGASLDDAEYAVAKAKEYGATEIAIMHGFQNFPTKLEDTNLERIRMIQEKFGLPVGYAGHLDGDDELAVPYPLMPMGMNAVIMEKHITWDRSQKGVDYQSSLNPDEFKKFVEYVRRVEKSLGSKEYVLNDGEKEYRKLVRKYILAQKDLKAGDEIKIDDIHLKRVEKDLPFLRVEEVVGKTAARDVPKNEVIVEDMLK